MDAQNCMTTLKLKPVESPTLDPYGDPEEWKKPSVAIIASGEAGSLVVDHIGIHLDFEINEGALGLDASELGIEPPEPGFWLWIGRLIDASYETDCGREYDHYLDGSFEKLDALRVLLWHNGELNLEKYQQCGNDDEKRSTP